MLRNKKPSALRAFCLAYVGLLGFERKALLAVVFFLKQKMPRHRGYRLA